MQDASLTWCEKESNFLSIQIFTLTKTKTEDYVKSILMKNVVLAAVLAGNVVAADSFKVKVTGHGQVKVKPDAIASDFTAISDCADSMKASQAAWAAQYKVMKDALEAKVSDLEIRVTQNTSKSDRIQRVRVKNSPYPYQHTYKDTCAAAGKDAVALADLVDGSGNIVQEKLGEKYSTSVSISVSTVSANTRALQDALQDMPNISFASVTPVGTSFKLNLPRNYSTITRPVVSEELRKKNKVVAQRKADRNAKKLLKVFKKLGFDQVPGSKVTLSRDTQTVAVQHKTNKKGEITAQQMGLDFTVVTEAMEGVDTEVNVVVNATKAFAPDYFEATYSVTGDCYATKDAAVAARKAFVQAMDQNVMVAYQSKTPVRGVDRQDPRDAASRKVSDRLTNIEGRAFTSDSCVLEDGAVLTEWTGKKDQVFWSFSERYTAKDTRAALNSKVAKSVQASADAVGAKVEASKVAKRWLDTKEKGQNRIALLKTLNEKTVNNEVCDALENDEFSGKTGTIVGCRITDQNGSNQNFGGPVFTESAMAGGRSMMAAKSLDSSNELALQAVQVTTTLEVEVFNKTVSK